MSRRSTCTISRMLHTQLLSYIVKPLLQSVIRSLLYVQKHADHPEVRLEKEFIIHIRLKWTNNLTFESGAGLELRSIQPTTSFQATCI